MSVQPVQITRPRRVRRMIGAFATLFVAMLLLLPAVGRSAAAAPTATELTEALTLTPGVTTAGATPSRWSVDLRDLSAEDAQAQAKGLSSRLYGANSAYPFALHQPVTFQTNYSDDTELGFFVSAVCNCGGAVAVSIDGEELHRLDWPAAKSTTKPRTLYHLTVPAGERTISISMPICAGPVVIDSYTFAPSVEDFPADQKKVDLDAGVPASSTDPAAPSNDEQTVEEQPRPKGEARAVAPAGVEAARTANASLSLAVDQSAPKQGTRADITGISIGKQNLSRPAFMGSPNLAQYLKTLYPEGTVLRIGGSQADQTIWSREGQVSGSCIAKWTVTPDGVDELKKLVDRTGYRVVYGVNLAIRQPERAADEIAYVHQVLGESLESVEIGNEPDMDYYKNDPDRFWEDFQIYLAAIKARTPSVDIIGPTSAAGPGPFVDAFVEHEKAKGEVDVVGLGTHRYSFGGCSNTLARLLSVENLQSERNYADKLVESAARIGVDPLLSETNSTFGGGCAGVSDNLGAALWTLDATLTFAEHGLQAAWFHTSFGRCGDARPDFTDYSAFCAATDEDAAVAKEQIKPPFYGLLALGKVGKGTFLNVTGADDASVRAYAIRDRDQLKVVLVNIADPAKAPATDVSIDLGKTYRAASAIDLATTSDEGLSATTGISLGGGTVGTDGVLKGMAPTAVPVDGSNLSVNVPAGSAKIITLDRAVSKRN